MSRFTLRLAAILTLLTFAVILIARAQPYDDGGLRETLFSDNCKLPCFMGIRPGSTTINEAARLLGAHPWVTNMQVYHGDFAAIRWDWNGRQPALLRQVEDGNYISFDENGLVDEIDTETAANVGTFTLLIGAPDALDVWSVKAGDYRHLNQVAIYKPARMVLRGEANCPVGMQEQWTTPVQISLYNIDNKVGAVGHAHFGNLRNLAETNC